jgi:hypothetical protein
MQLARAGGMESFPAYSVLLRLARLRLNDPGFRTLRNDIIDEWHACYVPYASIAALDRRTAARYRDARPRGSEHLSQSLEGVLSLIADGPAGQALG